MPKLTTPYERAMFFVAEAMKRLQLSEAEKKLLQKPQNIVQRKLSFNNDKGKTVEVTVLTCEPDNHRITLGMKQLVDDPWPQLIQRFSVGAPVEGTITKVAGFGLFVEIAPDVEGLMHLSELELGPTEKLDERYKVGEKVRAQVIKLDELERRIGLSNKNLPNES